MSCGRPSPAYTRQLHDAALEPGILDGKTKELIALAFAAFNEFYAENSS